MASPGDSLTPPPLALDEAELRQLILGGPDVQVAEATLSAAQSAATASWTDYLPSINLTTRAGQRRVSRVPVRQRPERDSGSARLSVSLPVFDQFRRRGQVVQAQVAREPRKQRSATRAARRGAEPDPVARRVPDGRAARGRAGGDRLRGGGGLRLQQQRYAVGSSTLLDVLASQTELDQARRDLIARGWINVVAKAQLEALAGREPSGPHDEPGNPFAPPQRPGGVASLARAPPRRVEIAVAAGLVVLILAVGGFNRENNPPPPPSPAEPVDVQHLGHHRGHRHRRADHLVEVKSKASRPDQETPVEVGSVVREGDLLAQIDTRDVQNQYAGARATWTPRSPRWLCRARRSSARTSCSSRG